MNGLFEFPPVVTANSQSWTWILRLGFNNLVFSWLLFSLVEMEAVFISSSHHTAWALIPKSNHHLWFYFLNMAVHLSPPPCLYKSAGRRQTHLNLCSIFWTSFPVSSSFFPSSNLHWDARMIFLNKSSGAVALSENQLLILLCLQDEG